MTLTADHVNCYTDTNIGREVVAVNLGHKHYLVLFAGGVAVCEVRRYEYGQLHLRADGRVSVHRLKHITKMVTARADYGVEAFFAEQIRLTERQPHPIAPLQVDEQFFNMLQHSAVGFNRNVEMALRGAVLNAHRNPESYAYARSLQESWMKYGISGLKMQIGYLIDNLRAWAGPQAVTAKRILRRWSDQ